MIKKREVDVKKRRVMILFGIAVLLVLAVFGAWHAVRGAKLNFAKRLANGMNLGNSLDANGLFEFQPDAGIEDYETFWGNPKISERQFQAICDAGFQSVRIPVTWEEHIDAQGTISKAWMDRVEEVVSMALDTGLYVILNTHHETWLNLEIGREDEIAARYQTVWTQIAQRFADYDSHLLFEGMNEPRLRDSEYEWGAGTEQMQEMVNRLNVVFTDTVRAAGGKNKDRYLLVSPYASNHITEGLEALAVPDGNIIVSVHVYVPYDFCQNEEGSMEWNVNATEETGSITQIFEDLDRLFLKRGIPVMITEFGCVDKANLAERIEWTAYFTGLAAEYKVPCFWWDNGSTYRLLDRETNQWRYPKLVETITKP